MCPFKSLILIVIFIIFQIFKIKSSETSSQIECIPHNATHMELAWNNFKKTFNKTYSNKLEARRRKTWFDNCQTIYEHNKQAEEGIHSFTLRPNHLSDLTEHNYRRQMVKLTHSSRRKLDPEFVGISSPKLHHIPKEIDWRDKGFVTPPANQRECGSCYAFSIAHVIEAQLFKRRNVLIPLSEQQLIDCSSKMGNYGCSGGSLRNTLRYIKKFGGIEASSTYPYVAKETRCQHKRQLAVVNITDWAILPARDEYAMEKTVAEIGPIAVSVNASPRTFQLYHKGIYDDVGCSADTVNHAMVVIGYTRDAWILKNWWGEHWGENGYMRLRRHRNQCGVANYVAYAQVD